jgi:hypothetical protein
MVIITGRHRLDLARRMGEKTIPAQIVHERDGFTLADALIFDAHSNIRDGQGTTEDYAHYFKNSPSLTEANAKNQGLLDRAKGRDGWSLGKNASDDLYAPWMDKKITTEKAVAIVEAAPTNHNLQRLGLKQAANGKTISDLKNFIHAIDANAGGRAEQIDLLGRDDSAIKEAEEMGACASKHQREVIEKIRAVLGAAKRPELAAQEGVVVDDPQSVLEQVSRNKLEQERWQKWYLHPDLVAKIKGEIENQPRGKVSLAT